MTTFTTLASLHVRLAAAVLGIALTSSLVACSSPPPTAPPTGLAGVETKLVDALEVTLSKLPAHATLTRSDPNNPAVTFGPGTVAPCEDATSAASGKVYYTVEYVLGGVEADRLAAASNNLVVDWRMLGWAPARAGAAPSDVGGANASTPTVTAKIGDGYTLTMAGTFQLYFTGKSACFPAPAAGDKPNAPNAI